MVSHRNTIDSNGVLQRLMVIGRLNPTNWTGAQMAHSNSVLYLRYLKIPYKELLLNLHDHIFNDLSRFIFFRQMQWYWSSSRDSKDHFFLSKCSSIYIYYRRYQSRSAIVLNLNALPVTPPVGMVGIYSGSKWQGPWWPFIHVTRESRWYCFLAEQLIHDCSR